MWNVQPIPALNDNYIWAISQGDDGVVWVVDPGEAAPVEAFLKRHQLQLGGIVVTHHHWDHTNGVAALLAGRDIPVFGPSTVAGVSQPLDTQNQVQFAGLCWQVLAVPGHTLDHLAYFSQPPGQAPLLLCGDTLFSAGCGRLFEGSPEQMLDSLKTLAALPGETRVYCTHEYTAANLRFAHAVEPDNEAVSRRLALSETWHHFNPSLPSTIATEHCINPFLRCQEAAVIAAALQHGATGKSEQEVFSALRAWKNHF